MVNSNTPLNGTTNVPVDVTISVTFSEDMEASTIDTNSFTLSNGATGTVGYDPNTNTATLTPTDNLNEGTTYTATVTTGVENLARNTIQAEYAWSFTTNSETESDGNSGGSGGCFVNTMLE